MTIRSRLAIFISTISILCILLTSGIVLIRAGDFLEKQNKESLRSSNNSFRFFFEEYVQENQRLISYAATNRDFIDALNADNSLTAQIAQKAAAEDITTFKEEYPQIRYFFIDQNGLSVLGDMEPKPGYFFLPYIKEDKSRNALLRIEAPIPDSTGTKAVILTELDHLVSERLNSIRMNQETHFFLIYPANRSLLLHTAPNLIAALDDKLKKDDSLFSKVSTEGFHSYEINNSRRMAYIKRFDDIAFGVSIPYDQFELSRKSLFQLSLLAVILIIILSTLASLLASRYLTRQLRDIAHSVQEISEQNYDRRIEVGNKDELAVLSRAVNTMAEQIQIHTENLESLIDDRTTQLREAMAELEEISVTDSLTGLKNRKLFEETLRTEIVRARRGTLSLGLIYFDLDHFKAINDVHGHNQGDKVLINTAKMIKENTRLNDFSARWGGEEFVIILPDTDKAGLLQAAEKLRSKLEMTAHPVVGVVTASFGCTVLQADDDLESLVGRCDEALYVSKENGRNRVSFA